MQGYTKHLLGAGKWEEERWTVVTATEFKYYSQPHSTEPVFSVELHKVASAVLLNAAQTNQICSG